MHNLGPNTTSRLRNRVGALIGRRRELDDIEALLRKTSIVTLTGPEGIGKTAIAQHIAGEAERKGGAVVWLDCGGLDTADEFSNAFSALLDQNLARVEQVTTDEGEPNAEAVELESRFLLVVLDEFRAEHVTEVRSLVRRVRLDPRLRILVTSERPLSTVAERVVEIGRLLERDGLEMFLGRCAQYRPGWRPSLEESKNAAQIIGRLDGVPLLIELAASRARFVELAPLNDALENDLSFLACDWTDDFGCHRSLLEIWARIESRLRSQGGSLFVAAAVFSEPFATTDFAAVAEVSQAEAIRALHDLRELSFLHESSPGHFRMYHHVRAQVLRVPSWRKEKIAAEERHDAYFLQQFDRGAIERRDVLETVLLRNAAGPAESGESEDSSESLIHDGACARRRSFALEAVVRLEPNAVGGRMESLIERVLSDPCTSNLDRTLLAMARVKLARCLGVRGEHGRALVIAREALLDAMADRDARTQAKARLTAAQAMLGLGQFEPCIAELELLKGLAEISDYDILLMELRLPLGEAKQAQGHMSEAEELFYEGRDRARMLNLPEAEAKFEGALARLAHDAGRFETARLRYARAQKLESSHKLARSPLLWARGALAALEDGSPSEARDSSRVKPPGLERPTACREQAVLLLFEANVEASLGNVSVAQTLLNEAAARASSRDKLFALMTITEGHVHLARWQTALADNDRQEATREMGLAEKCLAQARKAEVECDIDARILCRLLEHRIAVCSGSSVPRVIDVPFDQDLLLGPDISWFWLDGIKKDLARKPILRRILQCLTDVRARGSMSTVAVSELVAFVWPGEPFQPEVHINRLHVALSSLRTLGLKSAIQRVEDGYRIAPWVRVDWVMKEPSGGELRPGVVSSDESVLSKTG